MTRDHDTGIRRRTGRRPGDPQVTKEAILAAARDRFGAAGYERATIRSIAASAAVDPALVIYHFKNKQALFTAAHKAPGPTPDILTQLKATPHHDRGEFITRTYLTIFTTPGSSALSLLRAAATNDHAAQMLRESIDQWTSHLGEILAPGRDERLPLALATCSLLGVVLAHQVFAITPIADTDIEQLVSTIAPTLQHHLNDTLSRSG